MEITGAIHQRGVALLRSSSASSSCGPGWRSSRPQNVRCERVPHFGTLGTLGWPFVTGEVAEGTVFNPTHDFWVALAQN